MFARTILLILAAAVAFPVLAQQPASQPPRATTPQATPATPNTPPATAPTQAAVPPTTPSPAGNPDPAAALTAARLASPTPIGEIPQASFVMIMGSVVAANMADFVLSDGHASVVVDAGHGWASKSGIRVGDRIRVIGRMDAYGTGRFVGGLVTRADGKSTPLQPLD